MYLLSSFLCLDILLVRWLSNFNFPKMFAAIFPDPHSLLHRVLTLAPSSNLIPVPSRLSELVTAHTKRVGGLRLWLPSPGRTEQPAFALFAGALRLALWAISEEFWWFWGHQAVRKPTSVGDQVWALWLAVLIFEPSYFQDQKYERRLQVIPTDSGQVFSSEVPNIMAETQASSVLLYLNSWSKVCGHNKMAVVFSN